jgi:hypothetical protein
VAADMGVGGYQEARQGPAGASRARGAPDSPAATARPHRVVGGHVGTPKLTGAVGTDRTALSLGAFGAPDPLRGLEAVPAHRPPDPLPGGPGALVARRGRVRTLRSPAPRTGDPVRARRGWPMSFGSEYGPSGPRRSGPGRRSMGIVR